MACECVSVCVRVVQWWCLGVEDWGDFGEAEREERRERGEDETEAAICTGFSNWEVQCTPLK